MGYSPERAHPEQLERQPHPEPAKMPAQLGGQVVQVVLGKRGVVL